MNELDEQTRPAVLKHEALHIVYHHLTRKLGYEEDPVITNLAMDIQINQEILPWQLPESGVFTHTFPELFGSWDSNNKSSRYYYSKLISLKNEMVEFTGGAWPSSDNDFDWSGISSPLSAQNLANLYPSSPHRDVLPMHRPEPQSPSDNQSANENKSSSSVVHRPQRQDETLSESTSCSTESGSVGSEQDIAICKTAIGNIVQNLDLPESIRRGQLQKSHTNWKELLRKLMARGKTKN